MKRKPWFDEHGWMQKRVPRECIAECSAVGDVDESVHFWRAKLHFDVPRELAIAWLREFGAWTAEELATTSDETLAERCLWLMCCDARENKRQPDGLIH
jgi:hypothetical protein